jgi:hypothetical protein
MRRKDTDHRAKRGARAANSRESLLLLFSIYGSRPHGLPGKDAPRRCPNERFGNIVAHAILGGLRHRYARIWFLEGTTLTATRQSSILMLWNQVVWGMSENWLALALSMVLRRLYKAARRRPGSRLRHCLDLRPIDTSHSEDAGSSAGSRQRTCVSCVWPGPTRMAPRGRKP